MPFAQAGLLLLKMSSMEGELQQAFQVAHPAILRPAVRNSSGVCAVLTQAQVDMLSLNPEELVGAADCR